MLEPQSKQWPSNARVAVSLTYDGALPEHLDIVGPTLSHFDLLGTFFLSPTRTLENIHGWQKMAESGHEMGNGSLLGVTDDGRLPNWTLRMVEQDLHMTQAFFASIFPDGEPMSFAYPGKHPQCSQGSYRGVVNDSFAHGRSAIQGINRPRDTSSFLRSRDMCSRTNDELHAWREVLLSQLHSHSEDPIWHVLRFAKMFEGDTNRAVAIHELCVTFLATQKEHVWIAPVQTVASQFEALPKVSIPK